MPIADPRPFTTALKRLRDGGATYASLSHLCGAARSTSWFNTLVNSSDPWRHNDPPPRRAIPGLARMFRVSAATVCQWTAIEWYGVGGCALEPQQRAIITAVQSLTSDEVSEVLDVLAEGIMRSTDPDTWLH